MSFVDDFGGRDDNLQTLLRSSGTAIRFRIPTEFVGFRAEVYKLTCESEAEYGCRLNFHYKSLMVGRRKRRAFTATPHGIRQSVHTAWNRRIWEARVIYCSNINGIHNRAILRCWI